MLHGSAPPQARGFRISSAFTRPQNAITARGGWRPRGPAGRTTDLYFIFGASWTTHRGKDRSRRFSPCPT